MMRLRTASMRYETGLIVAIARNQSTSMRFRGAFIDDMNRKMNSTGKSAWIASPDPVRSAMKAPSIPKPAAIRVARTRITTTPATPDSISTPKASAHTR